MLKIFLCQESKLQLRAGWATNPNNLEKGLFARTGNLFPWKGSIPDLDNADPGICLSVTWCYSSWEPHESVPLHMYGSCSCIRRQNAPWKVFATAAVSGENGRPWYCLDRTLSGSKTTAPSTRQGPGRLVCLQE